MLATESPITTERRRSEQTLREQIATVVAWLSGGQSDADAGAMFAPGYRPLFWDPDYTGCAHPDCRTIHDHSPHPRHVGRWESEIDAAVDRWPRHVRIGVPLVLNTMDAKTRRIVRGVAVMGQSFRELGRQEGHDHHTIRAHYDAALECIARSVWDEEGQPRY